MVMRLDLAAGREEFISETQVALQQVGLEASGRLDSHLGAVLENRHGELVAGQTREPQPEVSVHLKQITQDHMLLTPSADPQWHLEGHSLQFICESILTFSGSMFSMSRSIEGIQLGARWQFWKKTHLPLSMAPCIMASAQGP